MLRHQDWRSEEGSIHPPVESAIHRLVVELQLDVRRVNPYNTGMAKRRLVRLHDGIGGQRLGVGSHLESSQERALGNAPRDPEMLCQPLIAAVEVGNLLFEARRVRVWDWPVPRRILAVLAGDLDHEGICRSPLIDDVRPTSPDLNERPHWQTTRGISNREEMPL